MKRDSLNNAKHLDVKKYQAVSREEAEARLKRAVEAYTGRAKRFSDWLDENFAEGMSFYSFPKEHWKKIRTVNIVERLNQEQKRRTRVARLFPSVESCERLVVIPFLENNLAFELK